MSAFKIPVEDQISGFDFGVPQNEQAYSGNSILCIDDGGVRGYVALLMLKALMETISSVEEQSEQNQHDGKSMIHSISRISTHYHLLKKLHTRVRWLQARNPRP